MLIPILPVAGRVVGHPQASALHPAPHQPAADIWEDKGYLGSRTKGRGGGCGIILTGYKSCGGRGRGVIEGGHLTRLQGVGARGCEEQVPLGLDCLSHEAVHPHNDRQLWG